MKCTQGKRKKRIGKKRKTKNNNNNSYKRVKITIVKLFTMYSWIKIIVNGHGGMK